MYYKKSFRKEDDLAKRDLLYCFMILEHQHKTSRGETRWISLHCKYNFDEEREKFYNEDIDVYLIADEETDNVRSFVNDWGFEKEKAFPQGVQHILGNYEMSIMALDGFIVR